MGTQIEIRNTYSLGSQYFVSLAAARQWQAHGDDKNTFSYDNYKGKFHGHDFTCLDNSHNTTYVNRKHCKTCSQTLNLFWESKKMPPFLLGAWCFSSDHCYFACTWSDQRPSVRKRLTGSTSHHDGKVQASRTTINLEQAKAGRCFAGLIITTARRHPKSKGEW